MMRRVLEVGCLLAGLLLLSGHVGSPTIIQEGTAGGYPVRVIVRPPEVIPGQAEISIRTAATDIEAVTVRPVPSSLGLEGAPRADPAVPIAGEPGLWNAQLWLMDFGSYSVHVGVRGPAGEGTLIVPVAAVATTVKEMPAGLGLVLAGLMIFLVVGLLTIVGAAVREAVLPPGVEPDTLRVRRSWRARAIALPIFVLVLLGGSRWWRAENAMYERYLYRPPDVSTQVTLEDGARILTLTMLRGTSPWTSGWTPLIPDHGKVMHLFLVGAPGVNGFAHLHPARIDSLGFSTPLPPLPDGEYRLYADILHESGFAQTLTDTVHIPAGATFAPGDADDSWSAEPPSAENSVRLADGSTMTWERTGPIQAGREITLRFQVTDPSGAPARLEPYMGMQAHAAVARDDGSVFVHLHPGGTVSMTAQGLLEQITRGDTVRDASGVIQIREPHATHDADTGTITIPYEFPRPGDYHLWVQVKRNGRILTGAFEMKSEE